MVENKTTRALETLGLGAIAIELSLGYLVRLDLCGNFRADTSPCNLAERSRLENVSLQTIADL